MEIAGIYNQFYSTLLLYVRSKIRSKEDAEDIIQNVFIKISANIEKLAENEKLKSWIYTITRNAVIDYYRVNSGRKNISVDDELTESFPELEGNDPTKGLDQCMSSMIELLPEEYHDIIIDSEIKGIRQKELAEKYEMAYPTMRSRVQRGRERLKQLFYNCCHIKTDRMGNVLEAEGRNDCDGPCKPCPAGQEDVIMDVRGDLKK
jgi:RNA polymerase sigma-70 factor (ECF subfamily)